MEAKNTDLRGLVYADGGGGLHLIVVDSNNMCSYVHTGYEHNPGQLVADMLALASGDNPARDWDGNEPEQVAIVDAAEDWDDVEAEFGRLTARVRVGGVVEILSDRPGASAAIELAAYLPSADSSIM